jgi:hypothetical protein
MKVKELIEKLSTLDPATKVFFGVTSTIGMSITPINKVAIENIRMKLKDGSDEFIVILEK